MNHVREMDLADVLECLDKGPRPKEFRIVEHDWTGGNDFQLRWRFLCNETPLEQFVLWLFNPWTPAVEGRERQMLRRLWWIRLLLGDRE